MEEKCGNEKFDKCVVCSSFDDCVHRYYVDEGRHQYVIPLGFFVILFLVYFLLT